MRVKVDPSEHQGDPKTSEDVDFIDFSNSKPVMILGYLIWLLVLVANGYVLITLVMGKDGCELKSESFTVLLRY